MALGQTTGRLHSQDSQLLLIPGQRCCLDLGRDPLFCSSWRSFCGQCQAWLGCTEPHQVYAWSQHACRPLRAWCAGTHGQQGTRWNNG